MERKSGIATQLAAIYLIVAVPLSLILGVVYYQWYEGRVLQLEQERLEYARLAGTTFSLLIGEIQRAMRASGVEMSMPDASPATERAILDRLAAEYPAAYVAFTDKRGIVLASSETSLVGQDFSNEPALQQALASPTGAGVDSVGEIHPDGFHVAQVIYDSRQGVTGVMVMAIDIGRLRASIPIPARGGWIGLIDADGHLVYLTSKPSLAMRHPDWADRYDFIRAAQRGRFSVTQSVADPLTHRRAIAAAAPIDTLPSWAVVSSSDYRTSVAQFFSSFSLTVPLTLLVVLVALIISALIAQRIARALRRLAGSAGRMGSGDFGEPVTAEGNDEIADVARSLDDARRSLSRYVRGLSLLSEASTTLSSAMDADVLRAAVVRFAEELFAPAAVWIDVASEEGESHEYLWHGPALTADESKRVREAAKAVGAVSAASGECAEVRSGSAPERVDELSLGTIVVCPLMAGGNRVGALGMAAVAHDAWDGSGQDLGLLSAFAAQVAISLENIRLFGQVRSTAESLRQRTETLQAVIAASPLAMITLDPEGNVLSWNPAAERIFGWREDEVLGHPHPIVPEDQREWFEEMLARQGTGEALTGHETERQRKDGSRLTVAVWSQPIFGRDGRMERVVLLLQDITLRKRAEAAVEENRQLLRDIIDSTNSVVYLKDLEGRFLLVNESMASIFGLEPDDMIGRTDLDFMPEDAAARIRRYDEQVARTGTRGQYEETFDFQMGQYTLLVSQFPLLNADGSVYAVGAFATDVTERARAEEEARFRALMLDSVVDSVLVYYTDEPDLGRVLYANEAAARARGYRREELIGKRVYELIAEPYRQRWLEWMQELAEKGEIAIESVHQRADGSTFPIEASIRVIPYRDRNVAVNTSRDVSERKIDERLDAGLDRLNTVVTSTLELDTMLTGAIREIATAVDSESAVMFVREPEGWVAKHALGEAERLLGMRLEDAEDLWPKFPRPNTALGISSLDEELVARSPVLSELHAESLIQVSVEVDGRFAAQLSLVCASPRSLTPRYVGFATRAAAIVSLAVRNATLFALQRRSVELGGRLNDINALAGVTLQYEDAMQPMLDQACHALQVESAAVMFRGEEGWRVAYSAGGGVEHLADPLSVGVALARLVAQRRELVASEDLRRDQRLAAVLHDRLRALIAVPLLVRDAVLGVLVFFNVDRPGTFGDVEQDFVRKLAVSVSLSMENSRLYAEERDIADTLQASILAVPEHIRGVRFATLYRSATEAAQVGGDFYDLFELERDLVGVLLGDVSGKGLEAATLTSLVKNTIRAYALESPNPGEVVRKANQAVYLAVPPASFITLFFGVLDVSTGIFTYSNAGHPPGFVLRDNGPVDALDPTGPIVGAFEGLEFGFASTELGARDTLLLYTDGVIEAHSGSDLFGEERLHALLSERHRDIDELPQAVFEAVLEYTGGHLADDVALLALSRAEDD